VAARKTSGAERLALDPVEQIGVYQLAAGLHEVAGQRIARARVEVVEAKARVEPARGCGDVRLRLQDRVEIVQDRVCWVNGLLGERGRPAELLARVQKSDAPFRPVGTAR
jgi:hypothetical protein